MAMSIQRLPNELLFDILNEACTHPFPRCRHLRSKDREREYQSPLTISHVSRRLRHLVLNSPFLWTCIHLTPESPSPGSFKLVELFLLRSGNLPISLTFVRHPKLHAKDRLWSLLMESVPRWQDVALCAIDPQDAIMIPLRDALAGAPLPQLRSLIFEVDGMYPRDVDLTLTAPNLHCARLTKMVLSPDSWRSCCRNLAHLSIGQVTFDSWFDLAPLLVACGNSLRTLLLGPLVGFKEREDEYKVSLPQLRCLSFTRGTGVGYDEILKNLVAPSLTEFVFDASAGEVVANAEAYCALLGSVRRLKILGGKSPETVNSLPKPFLHAFPNVEQLCLESSVAPAVLAFSCPTNEPRPASSQQDMIAWPALRELVINDSDAETLFPLAEDLLKFIQSRTREYPPIQVYLEKMSDLRTLQAVEYLDATFHEFDRRSWQGAFIPEGLASTDSFWRTFMAP
ncbi:hypothetical protein BDY19DRAFT_938037 [Irpex rosettiformis]|uniref:Uncharacterized protein n=1 Tax=Irpex rosettiformis TaxID=378272 RepID=A0ACB8U981_9APHY|nr:hypothetical protein BDY19DRAFT_938037 [Irpex rosettiformis]